VIASKTAVFVEMNFGRCAGRLTLDWFGQTASFSGRVVHKASSRGVRCPKHQPRHLSTHEFCEQAVNWDYPYHQDNRMLAMCSRDAQHISVVVVGHVGHGRFCVVGACMHQCSSSSWFTSGVKGALCNLTMAILASWSMSACFLCLIQCTSTPFSARNKHNLRWGPWDTLALSPNLYRSNITTCPMHHGRDDVFCHCHCTPHGQSKGRQVFYTQWAMACAISPMSSCYESQIGGQMLYSVSQNC